MEDWLHQKHNSPHAISSNVAENARSRESSPRSSAKRGAGPVLNMDKTLVLALVDHAIARPGDDIRHPNDGVSTRQNRPTEGKRPGNPTLRRRQPLETPLQGPPNAFSSPSPPSSADHCGVRLTLRADLRCSVARYSPSRRAEHAWETDEKFALE